MSNKKILFLSVVHGNEKFSIKILRKLNKELNNNVFNWIIANERAFKRGVRFIDADLNRVAPGDRNSKKYEVRRAYELLKECRKYQFVIDIHGTDAKTGIFTIVTNPKVKNLLLAALVPVERIVIWGDHKLKSPGPLTKFINQAIEIECGPKKSKKIQLQLYKILKTIIEQDINFDRKLLAKKKIFKVYGKLTNRGLSKAVINRLKEFKKITIQGESFYPLLVGRYKDIACYKMKKVN